MMLVLSLVPSKKSLWAHPSLPSPLDPFNFLDKDDAFFYLLILSILNMPFTHLASVKYLCSTALKWFVLICILNLSWSYWFIYSLYKHAYFCLEKISKLTARIYTSVPSDLAFAHTSGLELPSTPLVYPSFLNLL